jgi:hypothetical protein
MGIILNGNTNSLHTDSGSTITVDSGTKIVSSAFDAIPYDSGEIIDVTHVQSTTRVALNNTSSLTLFTGTVTKRIAASTLHIVGQLPHSYGNSYNMGYWWQIGSSGLRRDGIFQKHWSSDDGHSTSMKLLWTINSNYSTSSTGSLSVSVGYASLNGGGDSPGNTNPNASDDAGGGQTSSDLLIFEVVN